MKIFAALVAALLTTSALAASKEVDTPFNDVWQRALKIVAFDGFNVTADNRESGLIQASRVYEGQGEWFRCQGGQGAKHYREISITIAITNKKSNLVEIEVAANAREVWYRNRHFLMFKTGKVDNFITCESTGALERQILQRITTSNPE